MKGMKCPYCHTKVKFFQCLLRLFKSITSFWQCSNCQKESKFRRDWKYWLPAPILIFGGLAFGIIADTLELNIMSIGYYGLAFVFAISYLIGIPLLGWFVNTLDPIIDEEQIDKPSSESDEVSQDQSEK